MKYNKNIINAAEEKTIIDIINIFNWLESIKVINTMNKMESMFIATTAFALPVKRSLCKIGKPDNNTTWDNKRKIKTLLEWI